MQFVDTNDDIIVTSAFYIEAYNKMTPENLKRLLSLASMLTMDHPFLFDENDIPFTRVSIASFLNMYPDTFSHFYKKMERNKVMNRFYCSSIHDTSKMYMINPLFIRKRGMIEADLSSCIRVLDEGQYK